jgi:hypothetical protein
LFVWRAVGRGESGGTSSVRGTNVPVIVSLFTSQAEMRPAQARRKKKTKTENKTKNKTKTKQNTNYWIFVVGFFTRFKKIAVSGVESQRGGR